MDMIFPQPGEGPTPDALGDAAQLSAHGVARDYPHKWAATGLPDSLAVLDIPLQTVWAAVQLALSGANQHTLASTLGISEHDARDIIIVTTEQLVAGPGDVTVSANLTASKTAAGKAKLTHLARVGGGNKSPTVGRGGSSPGPSSTW